VFDNYKINKFLKVSSLNMSSHQPRVTAARLAKLWAIGETAAARTLQVTTQKGTTKCTLPNRVVLQNQASTVEIYAAQQTSR